MRMKVSLNTLKSSRRGGKIIGLTRAEVGLSVDYHPYGSTSVLLHRKAKKLYRSFLPEAQFLRASFHFYIFWEIITRQFIFWTQNFSIFNRSHAINFARFYHPVRTHALNSPDCGPTAAAIVEWKPLGTEFFFSFFFIIIILNMFRYKNTKTKTREEERFSRFDVILGFFFVRHLPLKTGGGNGASSRLHESRRPY